MAGAIRYDVVPWLQGQRMVEETVFTLAEPRHFLRHAHLMTSHEECIRAQKQWAIALGESRSLQLSAEQIYAQSTSARSSVGRTATLPALLETHGSSYP